MKKITLLVILIGTLSTGLYAQGGGVSGGLKAGLNVASQKFSNYPIDINADTRLGYHVGGFLSIMFSYAFGIQPELLFNSVGSKDNSGTDVARRFNYITLPVMFKYKPISLLDIHAGPQISTLVSAKAVAGSESETISDTKPVEFGVGVGVGLDLPARIRADVRYNVGLTDIFDDSSSSTETTNNYLQLSIGYRCFGTIK